MPSAGSLFLCPLPFHLYQVVGRALPTENDEHPKIYRMKLWAKSKFWYFLRKLKKVKKSNGQVLAINEHEKESNIEQVEQMQAVEKNLTRMAKEVEKLRVEVLSVEKKMYGTVPYAGGYINLDPSYAPPFQGGTTYSDGYSRPVMQTGLGPVEGLIPFGNSTNVPAAIAATGSQTVPSLVWGAPYDPSLAQR